MDAKNLSPTGVSRQNRDPRVVGARRGVVLRHSRERRPEPRAGWWCGVLTVLLVSLGNQIIGQFAPWGSACIQYSVTHWLPWPPGHSDTEPHSRAKISASKGAGHTPTRTSAGYERHSLTKLRSGGSIMRTHARYCGRLTPSLQSHAPNSAAKAFHIQARRAPHVVTGDRPAIVRKFQG